MYYLWSCSRRTLAELEGNSRIPDMRISGRLIERVHPVVVGLRGSAASFSRLSRSRRYSRVPIAKADRQSHLSRPGVSPYRRFLRSDPTIGFRLLPGERLKGS